MPSFRYRAVSRTGEALSGTLDVADRSAAIARLQSLGHVPLTTEQLDPGSLRALLSRDLFSRERLSGRSLADLIQQLGTLVGAGITVEQALALLAGSNAAGREQQVAAELLRRLRAGGSLADGMAAQPKLFPPISVSMVRAGEASGALYTTLARLGQYLKRAEAARQAVRSAMVYPAILTLTAFASVALILTVVLPQLRPLFHDVGGHLPVATQIALFLSDALRAWWWAIALAIAAAIAVTHRALADPAPP